MIPSQYIIHKPILQAFFGGGAPPLPYLIGRLGMKCKAFVCKFDVSPICWQQLLNHKLNFAALVAKEQISQSEWQFKKLCDRKK